MQVICAVIVILTLYLTYTHKVKTDALCIHLLWVAGASAGTYLYTQNQKAMIISMLFVSISGIYWITRELWVACSKIKSW